jgi:hypothetical protein
MATISANGGAERYWRASDGARLVLCRNGQFLIKEGGRWRVADAAITMVALYHDKRWQADTGSRASASVTRTQRMSRRGE